MAPEYVQQTLPADQVGPLMVLGMMVLMLVLFGIGILVTSKLGMFNFFFRLVGLANHFVDRAEEEEEMVRCRHCGHRKFPQYFCPHCGAKP